MSGRIITFSNLFPTDGRPTHALFVHERMRRVVAQLGCDWRVVCPLPRVPKLLRRAGDRAFEALPDRDQFDGVPVEHPRYFHLPGVSTDRQADRMTRGARDVVKRLVAEADGPCLIDAHYVYPDGVAAARLAKELGVPCFVTARGTDVNVLAERPKVREQIRDALQGAAGCFAVSEPLRAKFAAVLADEGSVRVMRNGVDFDRFELGDREQARKTLGLPADVALVGGVGRLIEGKGFHVMAKALRALPPTVHFAIVGDGPDRERIETLAPPGRLHFLGRRGPDEVAEFYRAADLLVLPSVREGWPNVVTEGLAAGLRVVGTPVGAIPQMLSVPYVGSLVRYGDSKALGAEVKRWLSAPADRQRIRDFARRFSWDEPIGTISTIYGEVLNT